MCGSISVKVESIFLLWRNIWRELQKSPHFFEAFVSATWSPQSPFRQVGDISQSPTSIQPLGGSQVGSCCTIALLAFVYAVLPVRSPPSEGQGDPPGRHLFFAFAYIGKIKAAAHSTRTHHPSDWVSSKIQHFDLSQKIYNSENWEVRSKLDGKIVQALLGVINATLLKAIQYVLSQILQVRWPVILDTVVCRHADLPYNIVGIVFRNQCSAFSHNL